MILPPTITIEALDEGYLLTTSDEKKIAATDIDMVIVKLKAFFGETKPATPLS